MARGYTLLLLTAIVFLGGCVTKSSHDREVRRLLMELERAKAANELTVNQLDAKLQDKARTLSDLTDRYMNLQRDKEKADQKLGSLRGDLLSLSNDVQELKLVVTTNHASMKGGVANELLIKLIDMEHRISEMLKAEDIDKTSRRGEQ